VIQHKLLWYDTQRTDCRFFYGGLNEWNAVCLRMQLTTIPFAQLIRLQEGEGDYTFCLPDHTDYTNHLGTVAAAAQFSLAEFATGQWLLDTFPDLAEHVIPMLRTSQVKFKQPATGRVRAQVRMSGDVVTQVRTELTARKRALCSIAVNVVNDANEVVMTGTYDWFLAMK